MDITKRLNDILVNLFNRILKIEEDAIKHSSKHNLSITEVHTLAAIGTGRAKTMTQVAASLKISVSTLTTAINKLVDKKYVNRFRVPEDRRIVKIELTEEGREAVLEHEEFHRRMIDESGRVETRKNRVSCCSRSIINMTSLNGSGSKQAREMYRSGSCLWHWATSQYRFRSFREEWGSVYPCRIGAAVAKCGGVGVISAAQIGFNEPILYQSKGSQYPRPEKKHQGGEGSGQGLAEKVSSL